MEERGHWKFAGEWPEEAFGFIYEITHLLTGKVYIGKKQMQFRRKKKLRKNKKNRQIVTFESDWKTYTGSNKVLNEDIAKWGKDAFKFVILRFCASKWELGYYEIAEQIRREVLLNDNFYNGIINCRLGRPKKSEK